MERGNGGGQNGQQVVLRDSRSTGLGMACWELEGQLGRERQLGATLEDLGPGYGENKRKEKEKKKRKEKEPDSRPEGGGEEGEVRLGAFWTEKAGYLPAGSCLAAQPFSLLQPEREE